ncbi:MAG: FAD-binding and (Fe-S)-binding domain-containing protein [Sphingobacteriaceae bacterium]
MYQNTETGIKLAGILPADRIKARLIDLVSYAADAGFYYLQPQAVVQPMSEAEITAIFHFSQQHQIPITIRTAGTSLSGQSITDGILVDLSKYWNHIKIEEEGNLVRVQPGITGGMVNALLKKYKKKIGPDPSSISSAMMGGIISNNSSGMCCGVSNNSYHTTQYIRFILPNGYAYTTENAADYHRFETECPAIFRVLKNYHSEISVNQELYDKIRHKYLTKNTVGYSLNAFIDFEHPLDILAHLLIGAEGTLGFISEATLRTIDDYPYKTTALLFFTDIFAACDAIIPLTLAGAEAVELMDRASLRSIEDLSGVSADIKLLPESTSALLIEFQGATKVAVQVKLDGFLKAAPELSLLSPPEFTEDPKSQAFLWKLRKGLFPAVGAVRASGTTVILEDIAFPVAQLGNAILDLQELFKKHLYHEAIIFGHAKDGNIHFVVTQTFNTLSETERYSRLIDDMVTLVINKYQGTLKAEHGTGRNMAPFVETEWGSEAYRIMKSLKEIIDPHNLLNPGVIINADKQAHLKNLKDLPTVEEEVDKCMECGYCEHVCPSRDITLTPRRRIVVRRKLANLRSEGNVTEFDELLNQYQYDGLETCAVDGLCAGACPVDINTGDLVKRLRAENHSQRENNLALLVAKNFKFATQLVSLALRSGLIINKVFGDRAMIMLTTGIRKIIPAFPLWSNQLRISSIPYKNEFVEQKRKLNQTIIYFPTCISRMMGGAVNNKKGIIETFLNLSAKAGIEVQMAEQAKSMCCGQLFSSKGHREAYIFTANKTIADLWQQTAEGRLPVVLDVTSCTHVLQHCEPVLSLENKQKFASLIIMDSIEYLKQLIIPNIVVVAKKDSVVLHPVCSLQKMGITEDFKSVASNFANKVKIPLNAGCCGMAGDRGFLFPELTASATAQEAAEVKKDCYDGYYSSAKTCEMAMSEAVGQNYESLLYLADECT